MSGNIPTYEQPAGHHLAELNIAKAVADLEDPSMAGFMQSLDAVNAIADRSPGFVWRLQDEAGNATSFNREGDPRQISNMSVWESDADLEFYIWNTVHRRFMKNRYRWFVPPAEPFFVMWWIEVGIVPTIENALQRLARARREGPSEDGFGWDNLPGARIWQTPGHPPA